MEMACQEGHPLADVQRRSAHAVPLDAEYAVHIEQRSREELILAAVEHRQILASGQRRQLQ